MLRHQDSHQALETMRKRELPPDELPGDKRCQDGLPVFPLTWVTG